MGVTFKITLGPLFSRLQLSQAKRESVSPSESEIETPIGLDSYFWNFSGDCFAAPATPRPPRESRIDEKRQKVLENAEQLILKVAPFRVFPVAC